MCSSNDDEDSIFKYKLCMNETYHKDIKLVQLSNSNSSTRNNTTFYNDVNKKLIVYNISGIDGILSYDDIKKNIYSNLTAADKKIFSDNFTIYSVNQNTTDSVNISGEGTTHATKAQPIVRLLV